MSFLWRCVAQTSRNIIFKEPSKVLQCTKTSALSNPPQNFVQNQPIRTKYQDARMLRDVKRRRMVKEYYPLRMRLNSIRKNTILPAELRNVASEEIAALPRDSCRTRIVNRCVLTSRPRGVRKHWRLSRIMWRHFADYNYMSGITRACW